MHSLLLVLFAMTSQGESVPAQAPRVVVGSKNFTESSLLAEVLAQWIEARTEVRVERRVGLGGTQLCYEALRAGEIDLYPEYTGTAWAVILGEKGRAPGPMETYWHVRRECLERDGIAWQAPLGVNNTYAIALRGSVSEELDVATLSELAARGSRLRGGFSIEFLEREDGYPGLSEAYSLELADVRGMEHALAYRALVRGEIDVMDAYSTDAKLADDELDIVLLADDRDFFPPYHAAPVVRASTLAAHPELEEALGELAFRIDDARMTAMNHAVELEDRSVESVARAFVAEVSESVGGSQPRRSDDSRRLEARERWNAVPGLLLEHLQLSLGSVLLAALIAIPLGIVSRRRRWVRRVSIGSAGVAQTIPSLALLAVLIAVPGLGLSTRSAVVALTLYALLPILRNTVQALHDVDPDLRDAALGMGLDRRERLVHVELPLAVGGIMAGVRTATVITVGFATLAAFIGAGGLGRPILTGLYLNDVELILSGAIPAAALAISLDLGLGLVERALTPAGTRSRRGGEHES